MADAVYMVAGIGVALKDSGLTLFFAESYCSRNYTLKMSIGLVTTRPQVLQTSPLAQPVSPRETTITTAASATVAQLLHHRLPYKAASHLQQLGTYQCF